VAVHQRFGSTRNSSNSSACAPTPLASSSERNESSSSRSVKRQLGSNPTIGTPRAANGAKVLTSRPNSPRACSISPAERNVRPQHSGRA